MKCTECIQKQCCFNTLEKCFLESYLIFYWVLFSLNIQCCVTWRNIQFKAFSCHHCNFQLGSMIFKSINNYIIILIMQLSYFDLFKKKNPNHQSIQLSFVYYKIMMVREGTKSTDELDRPNFSSLPCTLQVWLQHQRLSVPVLGQRW
jgi:hypothetical protein